MLTCIFIFLNDVLISRECCKRVLLRMRESIFHLVFQLKWYVNCWNCTLYDKVHSIYVSILIVICRLKKDGMEVDRSTVAGMCVTSAVQIVPGASRRTRL